MDLGTDWSHTNLGREQCGWFHKLWMIVVQFGNLRFPLDKNLGFLAGTKLGASNRLSCNGGKSSGRDLEIVDFVYVVKDGNDLR